MIYWYVYGHILNRLNVVEPHEGYADLSAIMRYHTQGKDPNWFIYHQGLDDLYERAMFDSSRIC